MQQKACEHQWSYVEGGPYDADEDAACYRDGLNYSPPGSYTVCTKCGKRRPDLAAPMLVIGLGLAAPGLAKPGLCIALRPRAVR